MSSEVVLKKINDHLDFFNVRFSNIKIGKSQRLNLLLSINILILNIYFIFGKN